MIFVYFCSLLFVSYIHGLKIFESEDISDYKLFYHRTAAFGPHIFNASAPLTLFHPISGCIATDDGASDSDSDISSNSNSNSNPETLSQNSNTNNNLYEGQIVLLLRGGCTFAEKVYNAQRLGAVGVIVGNGNATAADASSSAKSAHHSQFNGGNGGTNHNEEWIIMSKEDSDIDIHIPSVFVQSNTFAWIYQLLIQKQNDNEAAMDVHYNKTATETTSNGHPNDESEINIEGMQVSASVVFAMLDSDGEYTEPSNALWLATFGIIIVIIPTLWCLLVIIALLRRKCRGCLDRRRRSSVLTSIPVIRFSGTSDTKKRSTVNNNTKDGVVSGTVVSAIVTMNDSGDLNAIDDKNDNADDECTQQLMIPATSNISATDNTINATDAGAGTGTSTGTASVFANVSSFLSGRSGGSLFGGKSSLLMKSKPDRNNTPHNESCCICLEDFAMNEKLRLLPCCHAFHSNCIDPWLSESSELCPMCKQSIFMNAKKAKKNDGGQRNGNGNGNDNTDDDDNDDDNNGGTGSWTMAMFGWASVRPTTDPFENAGRNEAENATDTDHNDNSNHHENGHANNNHEVQNNVTPLRVEQNEELLENDFLHS